MSNNIFFLFSLWFTCLDMLSFVYRLKILLLYNYYYYFFCHLKARSVFCPFSDQTFSCTNRPVSTIFVCFVVCYCSWWTINSFSISKTKHVIMHVHKSCVLSLSSILFFFLYSFSFCLYRKTKWVSEQIDRQKKLQVVTNSLIF